MNITKDDKDKMNKGLEILFPVGSCMITNVNPNTSYGGVWQKVTGKENKEMSLWKRIA